ncbi:MAG: tetratricopeptide repeat protein [Pseudanabaena sp. M135S2SP2A07QC]|jgi:tetratricopeptide (TPR) repeat protein|nr:tetratricopeptide repeat protein [Pseudanabaena sp. M176S2SP2A07QC]MCA6540400.1 tetratricopeptide repeat protein [Pseudanabaena sp. M037S2SP2A07QC]MCA6542507.1 tetratricopeptide repeat protein [Pseudanabaena sp. M074S1SP2A07QC]MCA6547699.1 tetratricopeptide repeat protein [Pseudanabaena sp. M152S2SP2A07QC]MCA6554647.1 tetratricopeptide repeat protein [Pseudanabaena sp. M135S2SP2A07QC]MCA6556632.1 tetratricopeptide repeat protein [Pseudanabaena sp. M114S2SP2A07QC]MCA6566547.1 tetratricopept
MQSPLAPTDSINWNTAQLYLSIGRLNQALTLAYEVVQREPTQQEVYLNFCLKAMRLGAEFAEEIEDHGKAAFYWEQITQRQTQNVEAWYGLAVAKANLQDFRAADAFLRRALQLDPSNQKMRNMLQGVQVHLRN